MGEVHDFPADPPLTDIPARLRFMADQLEDRPDRFVLAVVVIEDSDGQVQVHAAGKHPTQSETVGVLARAMARLA